MCFHKYNYVLIDDGTPDSITSLFDLAKLVTHALLSSKWILALYKYIIIIILFNCYVHSFI